MNTPGVDEAVDSWSPDGTKIVFTSIPQIKGGSSDINVLKKGVQCHEQQY